MAVAIVSALTGRPVRRDVAMTGEITLRGRVLAIGGLKEKLIAARLVGADTVIIPKENEKDLTKISKEILDGLSIHPVTHADEVLRLALEVPNPDTFMKPKDVVDAEKAQQAELAKKKNDPKGGVPNVAH